jgi:mRNA-degrading endonuclease RelE of RelBE toxin-antitoxin system
MLKKRLLFLSGFVHLISRKFLFEAEKRTRGKIINMRIAFYSLLVIWRARKANERCIYTIEKQSKLIKYLTQSKNTSIDILR